MRNYDRAKAMLDMAKKDLRALEGMKVEKDTVVDEIFGFHAEQTIEKG